jgi:hypothetical protein
MAYITYYSMSDKEYHCVRTLLLWSLRTLVLSLIVLGPLVLVANGVLGKGVKDYLGPAVGGRLFGASLCTAIIAPEVALYGWRRLYIHKKVLQRSAPTMAGVLAAFMIFLAPFAVGALVVLGRMAL